LLLLHRAISDATLVEVPSILVGQHGTHSCDNCLALLGRLSPHTRRLRAAQRYWTVVRCRRVRGGYQPRRHMRRRLRRRVHGSQPQTAEIDFSLPIRQQKQACEAAGGSARVRVHRSPRLHPVATTTAAAAATKYKRFPPRCAGVGCFGWALFAVYCAICIYKEEKL
jgi:hypothetical protein